MAKVIDHGQPVVIGAEMLRWLCRYNGNAGMCQWIDIDAKGHSISYGKCDPSNGKCPNAKLIGTDSQRRGTGAKDSQGNEIFEHDVIEDAEGCRYTVEYDDEHAMFVGKHDRGFDMGLGELLKPFRGFKIIK
jgi:hypothetical protein